MGPWHRGVLLRPLPCPPNCIQSVPGRLSLKWCAFHTMVATEGKAQSPEGPWGGGSWEPSRSQESHCSPETPGRASDPGKPIQRARANWLPCMGTRRPCSLAHAFSRPLLSPALRAAGPKPLGRSMEVQLGRKRGTDGLRDSGVPQTRQTQGPGKGSLRAKEGRWRVLGSQGTEWGRKACGLQTALVALGSEPEPRVGAPDTRATPPPPWGFSMWSCPCGHCRLQGPAPVPWGGLLRMPCPPWS